MYIQGINPSETFAPTVVDTRRGLPFKLGTRGLDANGNEYLFVKASGALAAYECGLIDEGNLIVSATTTSSAPGTGAGKKAGVPQVALTDTYYGWVLRNGIGSVLGAASCAKFTLLNTTGTAGVLDDDATAGSEVIEGVIFSATLTGAAATACILDYPKVSRTL